jgi:hexokinase
VKFSNKEEFLQFFTELIDPQISVVAINFAYPLNPIFADGHLDGVLISGSKEYDFDEVVGEQIGKMISEEILAKRGQKISVSCANDTVCLLLSGLSQYSPDELFGGIVGTGINFAFFTMPNELVNLESSNFDKFSQSAAGQEIDRASLVPGRALFEKETSGAYLYRHYTAEQITSTHQLDQIARGSDIHAEEARNILDYSASLIACQVAGIMNFKQRNMVGVMEGSLFWKAQNYRSIVESYVTLLSPYAVKFVSIDEDSLIGAAMLVAS